MHRSENLNWPQLGKWLMTICYHQEGLSLSSWLRWWYNGYHRTLVIVILVAVRAVLWQCPVFPAAFFRLQETRKSQFLHRNQKSYAGQPGLHRFRALGSLEFFIDYSLGGVHLPVIYTSCPGMTSHYMLQWRAYLQARLGSLDKIQ